MIDVIHDTFHAPFRNWSINLFKLCFSITIQRIPVEKRIRKETELYTMHVRILPRAYEDIRCVHGKN